MTNRIDPPDLEHCPFCGSTDITVKQNMQLDGLTFILCNPCGAVVSFHGNELKQDAMAMWNRRANDE